MIIYYIINLSILIHVTVVAAQDGANFNYFSVSKFRLVVPQLEKEERQTFYRCICFWNPFWGVAGGFCII